MITGFVRFAHPYTYVCEGDSIETLLLGHATVKGDPDVMVSAVASVPDPAIDRALGVDTRRWLRLYLAGRDTRCVHVCMYVCM